ncbi:hypothetical protein L6164_006135 [Bauhinia variegata]|uniref:Uncharacterized protein n=1 Tax=Bauhinia variegata TaxID=167791 RepID=A0ACB9PSZ9_BAUVA|nr:hypothetical protein L6164_006135 [Bauhinia variegata]
MGKATLFAAAMFLFMTLVSLSEGELDAHFYDLTCPQLETIVSETVRNASIHDPKVPARILRMFFHDCFIRVCFPSLSHKILYGCASKSRLINESRKHNEMQKIF